MANTKISALPNAAALGGTEQIPAVQSGGDVKLTPDQLKTYLNPMTNAGDIIIGGASGTQARLPVGSSNQVLTINSGAPSWQNASGGGNVSNVGTPTNGQIAQWTSATTIQGLNASGLTAGSVSTIGGLITQGSNVTITGAGTSGSPYNISSSGGIGSSPISVISNIAALRSATTGTLSVDEVSVTGYYSANVNSAPDEGGGIFIHDSSDSSSTDDSGTVIVDASSRRWKRVFDGDRFSVRWYGAKGDGVTDDTTAIQGCLNHFQPNHDVSPEISTKIFFPMGRYLISTSLVVTSGQILIGVDRLNSILLAKSTLTGGIVALSDTPQAQGYVVGVGIYDLGFDTSATSGTVWAIHFVSTILNFSFFERLWFNCAYCMSTAPYAQSVTIRSFLSIGPVEQFLHLIGNRNNVYDLDKEGGSGNSSEPYIYVNGDVNYIYNTLLEQTGSANKNLFEIEAGTRVVLDTFYFEITYNKAIKLHGGCADVAIRGPFIGSIDISATDVLTIEEFNAQNGTPGQYITTDATSVVHIKKLHTQSGHDCNILASSNIIIDEIVYTHVVTNYTANKVSAFAKTIIQGGNGFVNASFDAGLYGWTPYVTPSTVTLVESGVAFGKAVELTFPGPNGFCTITQTFTITSAVPVGTPVTVSFFVKAVSGTGYVSTWIEGCGITGLVGLPLASVGSGWEFLTITGIISGTGTFNAGAVLINVTDVILDDARISFGTAASQNHSQFGSIELAKIPIVMDSAAPTTGTFPVGARALNSIPSVGAPKGWICTVAGTPGTWVSEGNL